MRKWAVFAFILVAVLSPVLPARADTPDDPSEILFLGSINSLDRVFYMSRAFTSKWREREPSAEIFTYVLPYGYFGETPSVYEHARALLMERYRIRRPALVVALGNAALDLTLSLRTRDFPEVPVIAIEVADSKIEDYKGAGNLYVFVMPRAGPSNLALARTLFPRLKRAVFLIKEERPSTGTDYYIDELNRAAPDLSYDVLLNPDFVSADAVLQAAEKDTAVIVFTPGWKYPDGRVLIGEPFFRDLSERYGLPVFTFIRDYLGTGLVGGAGITSTSWGQAAADLGISVLLDKKTVAPISVSPALEKVFVDYKALKRFGVPKRLIPFGAEIINLPPSFWNKYSTYIQTAGSLLLLGFLLLSVQILIRKRERAILLSAKEDLTRQVDERTRELRTANTELSVSNDNLIEAVRRVETMQENILRTEREVVLGRLAAGLAHNLNTPLSAIRSANESLKAVAMDERYGVIRQLLGFSGEQKALFEEYASRIPDLAAKTTARRSGSAEDLESKLLALGCPEAGRTAAALEDAGLSDIAEAELREFSRNDAAAVADVLFRCVVLARSLWIVDAAIEKSVAAVNLVREYNSTPEENIGETPVDVEETLRKALGLFEDSMSSSVEVFARYDTVPPVPASEPRLLRLWGHLIQNALQAMPEGGRLGIRLTGEKDEVLVRIEDNGVGIPDSIRDTLFDPFVTTRPLMEGMGLGLAYCRKLVDELSGSLSYESKPKGTIFKVSIPVREKK